MGQDETGRQQARSLIESGQLEIAGIRAEVLEIAILRAEDCWYQGLRAVESNSKS